MVTGERLSGDISETERQQYLRQLWFPPALERAFREDYCRKILPGLRGGLLLLLVLFAFQGTTGPLVGKAALFDLLVPTALILVLFVLTLHPRFSVFWQPAVVVTFCVLTYLFLIVRLSPANVSPPARSGLSAEVSEALRTDALLLYELVIILVGFVLTRLRFAWFVLGSLAVTVLGFVIATTTSLVSMRFFMVGNGTFIAPSLAALMFVTYLRERSTRGEFLANAQLAQWHTEERRRRKQTEGQLEILGEAIGSIVHDLGNPLTSVQTGTQTLRMLLKEAKPDGPLLEEVLGMVAEGAQMLDYLRLSLLEQSRALEGRPIPLECKTTPIRGLVEAGAHFQKPRLTSGRAISIVGTDRDVFVDPMKMITVFMNLIGNALKYSDGEVHVAWHSEGERSWVSVQDQGTSGVGISERQAGELFVAFGRLAGHAAVEGTGLGLLSVKRIIEAHGGEVSIEGYADGGPQSPPFTTSAVRGPSLLAEGFRTAFVVTCPNPERPQAFPMPGSVAGNVGARTEGL